MVVSVSLSGLSESYSGIMGAETTRVEFYNNILFKVQFRFQTAQDIN